MNDQDGRRAVGLSLEPAFVQEKYVATFRQLGQFLDALGLRCDEVRTLTGGPHSFYIHAIRKGEIVSVFMPFGRSVAPVLLYLGSMVVSLRSVTLKGLLNLSAISLKRQWKTWRPPRFSYWHPPWSHTGYHPLAGPLVDSLSLPSQDPQIPRPSTLFRTHLTSCYCSLPAQSPILRPC